MLQHAGLFSFDLTAQGLDPTALSSYIGAMQDGSPKQRHKLYGGIAASVALHMVIAAALFVHLPAAELSAPEEETVSVEIVSPPEEEAVEEPAAQEQPEEPALDLTMPEPQPEQQQPPPPPPEPQQEQADEQGGSPPPPEQSAASSEEQQPDPPPVEEQPAEEQAAEGQNAEPQAEEQAAEAQAETVEAPAAETQPEPQAQEEQQQPPEEQQSAEAQEQPAGDEPAGEQEQGGPEAGEQPPAGAGADAARGQALPVLRPVFEFGEEETGSEPSEGNAAQQQVPGEAPSETSDADASATGTQPDETADASSPEEPVTEPSAPALPDDISPPSVDVDGGSTLAEGESENSAGPLTSLEAEPAQDPGDAPPEENATSPEGQAAASNPPQAQPRADEAAPTEAKRLFSSRNTGDSTARTAMGNVPRGTRAGRLCSTELTEQLRNGSPAFFPDIVPSFPLPEGTVLDVKRAAFRSGGQWYDMRFRCEIDGNAMRVLSFGLDVGDPVPRSEWKSRGFPEF